jgi:hypothetical protein
MAMVTISSVSLIAFTRIADPPTYQTLFGLGQFHVDLTLIVGIALLSAGVGTYLFGRFRGAPDSWDLPFLALFVIAMVYSGTVSRVIWNPLVFQPVDEPVHLGAVKYMLTFGKTSGDVEYHQWPGSFIEVAALSLVLGITGDHQLIEATLIFSIICQFVIATCIYTLSAFFIKSRLKALLAVVFYYISGFYFIFGRSFFDPQFWAWVVFLVTYSCVLLSSKGNRLSYTLAFYVLATAIVIGHSITTVLLGVLLLTMLMTSVAARTKDLSMRFWDKALFFLVLFAGWTVYNSQAALTSIVSLLSIPVGIPFASFILQTGLGVNTPVNQVPFLITVLRYYRVVINILPIGLSIIFGLGLLIKRTKDRIWVHSVSVIVALLLFAVFELTLLSESAPFWERFFFVALPFLVWMSIDTLSRVGIRRALVICSLLSLLISFSFVAPYISVFISYSYPELNATKYLTHYSDLTANTYGFQSQFDELLLYEEPTWGASAFPSHLDYAFFLSQSTSAYNVTNLNDYLQAHPTFYTSQIVVRGTRDVVFFSTAYGLNYSSFWGRVDASLNSDGYNRIYDSSWVQIYSSEGT